MRTKLILLLTFSVSNMFAQTDSVAFQNEIDVLSNRISTLEKSFEQINTENQAFAEDYQFLINSQNILRRENQQLFQNFGAYKQSAESKIDSLRQVISSNSANINKTANELGAKIDEIYQTTNQSIIDLNKTVSRNTLYWIIAILVVALFVLLVFVLIRKQIFKQKIDLDSNLQDTRKALETEVVKLDNKLIEVFESQLKIINNTNLGSGKEEDYSLALRVADEIIRIQKNMSRMDENTKGLKQLAKSVERIQDEFASNGYEIVEMVRMPYDEKMNVAASFIQDEYMEKGKQIITRIIKPQVNYNGVMIQQAQIEVTHND
ncbi:MAG: hypothetical protein ACFCUM_03270 [Bacteroidales bacterium]